ncbi:hypothetical protein M422DRAFT_27703 [Sphaerobolus stellatus SS14]|nr:hypothetical protein M422DRAFT_27703 [Sphaerobolus stellatus SS14]
MAAPAAKAAAKAASKSADHTLYHVAPEGFWKKFRDAVVVNPEISTGLPIPTLHRNPQPGSRPELYSTPATKASDVAQNPYWKRDVRRAYPRLSVVTQTQLSTFLLQSPEVQASIAGPSASKSEGDTAITASESSPKDLTQAIQLLSQAGKITFSNADSIPKPANIYKKWVPVEAENAPHDPNAYWPMNLYK